MIQQDNLTQQFTTGSLFQTDNVDRIRARINTEKQRQRQKRWVILRNACILIVGLCVIAILLAPEHPVYNRPEKQDRAMVLTPDSLTEQGKAMVLARLKDPGSAQFRSLSIFHSDKATRKFLICGEVNARNGFGGYNGFTKFASIINLDNLNWPQSNAILANDPESHDAWISANKLCTMALPL